MANGMDDKTMIEVTKLNLQPDELLVVRFPEETPPRAVDEWVQSAKSIIPHGVGVMVLIGDVKLAVIKSVQADEDYDVGYYQ